MKNLNAETGAKGAAFSLTEVVVALGEQAQMLLHLHLVAVMVVAELHLQSLALP